MWLSISTLSVLLTGISCSTKPIHINFLAKQEGDSTYYLFRKNPSGGPLLNHETENVVVSKPPFTMEQSDIDTNPRPIRSFSEPVPLPASIRNEPQLQRVISSVIEQMTGATPVLSSQPLPLEKSNEEIESLRITTNGLGNQHHPQIVSPARLIGTPFIPGNHQHQQQQRQHQNQQHQQQYQHQQQQQLQQQQQRQRQLQLQQQQQHQQQQIIENMFLQNPGPFQNQQPLPLETPSISLSSPDLTNQINTNPEIPSLLNAPKENQPNYLNIQQNQEQFLNMNTPEPIENEINLPSEAFISMSSPSAPGASPIFLNRVFANQHFQNSDPSISSSRFSSHQDISQINANSASPSIPQPSENQEETPDSSFTAIMDTIFPPGEFNMEVSAETSQLIDDSSSAKWICYYNNLPSLGDSESSNKGDSDNPGSYACFSGSFKNNVVKHLFNDIQNFKGSRVRGGPLFVFQRGHFANQNFHG